MSEHIHAFLSQWTAAESASDAETLATLLTDDFCGVGPLGFVLSRPAWLDRHRQGLAYEQFTLNEIQIRLHGDVAVVTARNEARGTWASLSSTTLTSRPVSGRVCDAETGHGLDPATRVCMRRAV